MEIERVTKERYNKIIDEAYENYCNKYWDLHYLGKIEYGSSYYNQDTDNYDFETYSKEEFVDYVKTNKKFSEKWGLKIGEQLLDHIERKKLMDEYTDSRNMFRIGYSVTISGYNFDIYNKVCDSYNIPIKKIIIEYKNEIVEYYE